MKTKTKKLIIIISAVVVSIVAFIVGFIVVTGLTTTTVKDLRILEAETSIEISEKDVYLTANDDNYFDIKLKTSVNGNTNFIVGSTNTAILTVTKIDDVYRVNYKKAGVARVIVTTLEASNVKDDLIVRVNEYVPTGFLIKDVEKENTIDIFADEKEYRFNFVTFQDKIKENINNSSISVLDNYDKSVFKSVSIDDHNSQLVVSAYKSEVFRKEIITLQSKQTDDEGNVKVVNNFVIVVNIKGYYILDVQLMLSNTSNFVTSTNIYSQLLIDDSEGNLDGVLLDEGDKEVSGVYLTETVYIVYAKVRAVYTNGDKFDVTTEVAAENANKSQLVDYYVVNIRKDLGENNYSYDSVSSKFSYRGFETVLTFSYLEEGSNGYNNFVNHNLYKKEFVGNDKYFEYIYWDNRYKRNDAITNAEGKIVGFVDENYMK